MELRISELMDLYEDDSVRLAVGPVRDAERIKELTMKKLGIAPKHKARRLGRTLLIAAVVAVLLMGAALAVYHWTLADRVMEVPDTDYVYEMMPMVDASGEIYMESVQVAAIPTIRPAVSVQGLADSPESRAFVEWQGYKEQWNRDNPNWADAYGGDDSYYETPENYAHLYGAFLQEQAEALVGIAEKYGLTLHERREGFESERELCAMLGCEDFLSEDWGNTVGYCFEDGSFKADGWWGTMGLCLISTREGSFSVIGGLDPTSEWFGDYEQWSITAEDGTELLLILGDYRAQVLAQLPGAALTLGVYAGRLGEAPGQAELEKEVYALDAGRLEELALAIDYEALAACYETGRDISAHMDAVLAAPKEEEITDISEYGELNDGIIPWERDAAQNELVFEKLGLYAPAVLPDGAVEWFTASELGGDAGNGRIVMTWMTPENLDVKTDFDIFLRYEPAENFAVTAADETGESVTLSGWPAAVSSFKFFASEECVPEPQSVLGWDGWKTVRADGTLEGVIWYDEEAGLVFWMVNELPELSADEFLAMAASMEKQ